MKNKLSILILIETLVVLPLVMIASCQDQVVLYEDNGNQILAEDAVVDIVIEEGKISVTSIVEIGNMHSDGRAEVIYRFHNRTSQDYTPEIYYIPGTDIAKFESKAEEGYKNIPAVALRWIEIPSSPKVVTPGAIEEYTVTINIPKDVDTKEYNSLPDKWAFQTGVSGITRGVFQPAVGIWWLVSMK